MEILRVQGANQEWDRFVEESPGGTIFSTLRFLSYHPSSRFKWLNLAVKDGNDLVCVVAGGDVDEAEGRFFRSPVGSSFGGPVFRDDRALRPMADVVDALTEYVRGMGYAGIEIVLPPLCYSSSQDHGLAFVLGRAGYRLVSRDASLVVDLDSPEKDDLDPVLRRSLRRAEKGGVYVHATTALGGFYEVLGRSLTAKGTTPTHTLDELEKLFGIFPDRLILLEAALQEKVVGGCLLFLCNPRVGLAFYICDDRDHGDLRIAEATLYGALSLLKRSGYRYLDLGTVSFGNEVNWGLVRFKTKFRPTTYVREHYALSFKETRA
ncbi:MAG: GNAT family N-acetyltransferase [Candidatus Eisenbacteria bacterium]